MVIPRLGTDSGRPSQSFAPVADPVPFDPSFNTTLAWYDAGNAASVHHTANAVNTLDDLSGNARHISNTPTGRPTYDAANGKIVFNGTSNILYNTSPFLWARSEKVVYAVVNVAVGNDIVVLGETNSTSGSSRYAWFGTGKNAPLNTDICTRIVREANTTVIQNRTMGAVFTAGKKLVRFHEKDGMLMAWINGAPCVSTRAYIRNMGELSVTRFCVGGLYANNVGNLATMDLFELVVAEDDTFGEQYEGYLAHKHGLAADLPAGHRYKDEPPVQGDITQYGPPDFQDQIKAALFGDSLTSQNSNINSGVAEFANCGNFCWYNQLSNNRVRLQLLPTSHSKGVSGNSLSSMTSRLSDLDSPPLDYDVCFFMGGTNNLSDSVFDMMLRIDIVISYVTLVLNKVIVVSTITPKVSNPYLATLIATNEHIMRRHGSCMGRVISVDTNTLLNDGTGEPVANALMDTVHFSPYGSYLVGESMDAALEPYFGRAALPDFSAGNLLSNGVLAGTGGTGAGQVASGWTFSYAGPAPSPSKDGNDSQLIASNFTSTAANGNTWEFYQTVTGGFTNGDKLYAVAVVGTANVANISKLHLEMRLAPDSVQTVWQAHGNRGRNGKLPECFTAIGRDYVIVTPVLPLTTGSVTSVKVRMYQENDATGTLTTSDVTIKGIGLFKL